MTVDLRIFTSSQLHDIHKDLNVIFRKIIITFFRNLKSFCSHSLFNKIFYRNTIIEHTLNTNKYKQF